MFTSFFGTVELMVGQFGFASSDKELQEIDRSEYHVPLQELIQVAASIPNTPMLAIQKVNELVLLNMRWETYMYDRNLPRSPFAIAAELVNAAVANLQSWKEVEFIEGEDKSFTSSKSSKVEEKHHDLFQDLWVKFSESEYSERIERYVYRLKINDLFDGLLNNKRCIDLGCGHGNFAHALLRAGASDVVGLDFGEQSIEYARAAAKRLGEDRVSFLHGTVYEIPFDADSFDFVVQNGVFHHLDDMDKAIAEAARVIKTGGFMWYYTDGSYSIGTDLWEASVEILKDVPHQLVVDHLSYLNLSTGKQYHLGDGLNATYLHETWESVTNRLEKYGFGNFRRMVGGYDTDWDHDVIEKDKYGVEKFGSGSLRLLAEKIL